MLSWLTYYPALLRDLISCQSFTSCPNPKVIPSVFSISIWQTAITFIYYFFCLILVACVCTGVKCTHAFYAWHSCGGQRSVWGNWLSPTLLRQWSHLVLLLQAPVSRGLFCLCLPSCHESAGITDTISYLLWILRIKFRSLGLHNKCLYPLSRITSLSVTLWFSVPWFLTIFFCLSLCSTLRSFSNNLA